MESMFHYAVEQQAINYYQSSNSPSMTNKAYKVFSYIKTMLQHTNAIKTKQGKLVAEKSTSRLNK